MGTPNVDREQLSRQLARICSRPEYLSLLAEKNAFQVDRKATALQFAEKTIAYAFGSASAPKLLDPVIVTELVARDYPVALYRVYDGVDRAGTLGGWWGDRKLLKKSAAAATSNGKLDHAGTIHAILGAMFVHPHWNRGKDIARISIPAGNRTPAIIGLGDWRAMRSATDPDLPRGAADPLKIDTEQDLGKLGLQAMPGAKQYFLPLFNDMWVAKVPQLSPTWPFE